MFNPVGIYHQNISAYQQNGNANSGNSASLEQIFNEFFFEKMSVEDLDQALMGCSINQLHDILSLMFSEEHLYYRENLIFSRNPDDVNNTQLFLKTVQKKAIQYLYKGHVENKNILNPALGVEKFIKLFNQAQMWSHNDFRYPIANEININPVALLLYLPHELISILNPEALEESLKEIVLNKQNCLFDLNNTISMDMCKQVINRFNGGSLKNFSCTLSETIWIFQQPLFHKMASENLLTFTSLDVNEIERTSKSEMCQVLSNPLFSKKENKISIDAVDVSIKVKYLLKLAAFFKNASVVELFISVFYNLKEKEGFSVNNIVFGNFSGDINFDTSKGILCVDINEYFHNIDTLFTFIEPDLERIKIVVPSRDVFRILPKLSSGIKNLVIENSDSIPFSSDQLNLLFTSCVQLNWISMPLELIPTGNQLQVKKNQKLTFEISVSLQTLKLGRGDILKKIYHLNQLPCFAVEITLSEKGEKLNVERLFVFLTELKHPWVLNIQEDDIDWRNFYSLYLKIDEFDPNTQIKLLEIPSNHPKFTHYASQEVKDHILNHIFTKDLDPYPHLPADFYFSDAILRDVSKLQVILNNISARLPKLIRYQDIISRLLLTALKQRNTQENGDRELPLTLVNQIELCFWESLEAHNKSNFNEPFPPEIFELMTKSDLFKNSIARFSTTAKKNIIKLFPSSVEAPNLKYWSEIFRLVLKYQLLQNDSDFQEKIKEVVSRNQNAISVLFKIIDSTPADAKEKLIKSLHFLMDELNQWLLVASDFKEISKEEHKKYINLFLKTGWIPPLTDSFTKHSYFPYLLMDSISQALPHLNQLQKSWVSLIISKIAYRYPLSDEEQMKYMLLFKYHCVEKQLGFALENNEIFLDSYPVIFDQMINCYSRDMSYDPNYLNLGMQLATILLWQPHADEIYANKAITVVNKVITLIKPSNLPEKKHQMLELLKNSPNVLNLFKLSYSISKDCAPKNILPCADWFVEVLFPRILEVDEDIRYLMIHAIIELKMTRYQFNNGNSLVISKVYSDIIQRRGITKASKDVIIILIDRYKKLKTQLLNEEDKSGVFFKDFVALGKKMIEMIIESEAALPECFEKLKPISQWIIPEIIKELMESREFNKTIMSSTQSMLSMLKFFDLFSRLETLDKKILKVVFRSWKYLYSRDQIRFFSVKNGNFISHSLRYLVKHPERFFEKMKSIKTEILVSLKTIVDFKVPLDTLSSAIQILFENMDQTTFFSLAQFFPNDMKTLLKRELSEEEQKILNLCSIKLNPEHISFVRPLIEKPQLPLKGKHGSMNIQKLLTLFDKINFTNSSSKDFCNPRDLIIDNKVIGVKEFREYIQQLIENVLNNKKITAAPENVTIRRQFYSEIHNQLKHITYILLQKEPHECIAYLQTLGEIGSKCATQYKELTPLAYCLIQETDKVLVPCTIVSVPFIFNPKERFRFLSDKYLVPMDFKILLNSLDPMFSAEMILKNTISSLDSLDMGMDLENKAKDIYENGSLLWLLAYLSEYGFQNQGITGRLSSAICGILLGKNKEYVQVIKNIICRLYAFDPQHLKTYLKEFVQLHENDDLKGHLEKMEAKANQMMGVIQPKDLKDQILIYLHEERWIYLRTAMAKLPDMLESSIHSYKYIIEKLSPVMGIYEGYENKVKFEDKHVYPEAMLAAENIKSSFLIDYNILFILNSVKKCLKTKSAELADWFKANAPTGKDPLTFLYEIYDEDFANIKDEWIMYMLQRMGIIA